VVIPIFIIYALIPDFIDPSKRDIWYWWALFKSWVFSDDIIDVWFNYDSYFEYDNVLALLTGNQFNPFGFFTDDLFTLTNYLTFQFGGGYAFGYNAAYLASDDRRFWHETFGDYFDAYYRQTIYPAMPLIAWITFLSYQARYYFNYWRDLFFVNFIGFGLRCPDKIFNTWRRWIKVFMWPLLWMSYGLVFFTRLLFLFVYFFWYTIAQMIAFFVSLGLATKQFFDNLLWLPVW